MRLQTHTSIYNQVSQRQENYNNSYVSVSHTEYSQPGWVIALMNVLVCANWVGVIPYCCSSRLDSIPIKLQLTGKSRLIS
jgi:hypothetical protein